MVEPGCSRDLIYKIGIAGLVSLLAIVACDKQEERIARAEALVEAARVQITGTGTGLNTPLEQVSPAERAISGVLSEGPRALVQPIGAQFAVGSIICKLKSQHVPGVTRPTRQSDTAATSDVPLSSPSSAFDARALMLSTVEAYGLSGAVEAGRGGAFVLHIGAEAADPTQFAPGGGGPNRPPAMMLETPETACPQDAVPEDMRTRPGLATSCVVEALLATEMFDYVEKDYIFQHQFARRPLETPGALEAGPNDPLWQLQWNLRDYGTGADQSPGGAGFQGFWAATALKGSSRVTVAVVDTGLDLTHPDMVGSPNIAPGWDMVSDPRMANDGDGRDPDPHDPGDQCAGDASLAESSYHGTHVAGILGAGATNNGAGVAGGVWNVTVVPVRALGRCGGRLSDINDAIRWAGGLIPAEDVAGNLVWNDNPADIINLSIGLFQTCPASLQEAINAVVERGVIVVSAAGNAQIPVRLYAPGGCQNVITVAASDARGALTPYSNFGPEIDLMAPGGDLTRDDDRDGRPDGILSAKPALDCYDPVTGASIATCHYAYEQGTSMAAPHVSASLALLKSAKPDMTGRELKDALLEALRPREVEHCAAPCVQYPGAEPIAGTDGLCRRPCGGGLLDLSTLADSRAQ